MAAMNNFKVSFICTESNGEVEIRQKIFDNKEEAFDVFDRLADKTSSVTGNKYPVQMRYVGISRTILIRSANCSQEDRQTLAKADEVMDSFIGEDSEHYHVRRLILNPDWGHKKDVSVWKTDTLYKALSPVEKKAIELGGKDACLFVVSTIPEATITWDEYAIEVADQKKRIWSSVIDEGITVNGKKYVFFGHGTNAAKDNKSLWVLESIHDKLWEEFSMSVNPCWVTIPAKKLAYLVGLQMVKRDIIDLPFTPEDFYFNRELMEEITDKAIFVHEDDTVEMREEHKVKQNQFDGFCVLSVSETKILEWAKKCGVYVDDIKRRLEALGTVFSIRANNGALKAVVYNMNAGTDRYGLFQDLLMKFGVVALNGKLIDDICFFADESVRKTNIGLKGAYDTEEAWCDAIRNGFAIGTLIREHNDELKSSSYQVLQCACGASYTSIEHLGDHEAEILNKFNSEDGLKSLVGKERAMIAKLLPNYLNEEHLRNDANNKYMKVLSQMAEGRIHKIAHYGFIIPDVVYFAQHIAREIGNTVELTGMLKSHVFMVTASKQCGDAMFWRSPVMDIGAVCPVYIRNTIPAEYEEYFPTVPSTAIMMSCKGTEVTRVRGDYDGDHGMYSFDKSLRRAFIETFKMYGHPIVDWDVPANAKRIVDDDEIKAYAKSLVNTSELGHNCTVLSRMYGRKLDFKKLASCRHKISLPDDLVSWSVIGSYTRKANLDVDSGKNDKRKVVKSRNEDQEYVRYLANSEALNVRAFNKAKKSEIPDKDEQIKNLLTYGDWSGEGTVDKYVSYVLAQVSVDLNFNSAPDEEWDWRDLMYNPEDESRRGFLGLFVKGHYNSELKYAPDEGLFQHLCRRSAAEWNAIYEGEKNAERRMKKDEFKALVRERALAELTDYAQLFGRTIEDVYDVVLVQMTKFESQYTKYVEYEGTLRNLWDGFWTIFGGMAVEAAAHRCPEFNGQIDELLSGDLNDLLIISDDDDDDDEDEINE